MSKLRFRIGKLTCNPKRPAIPNPQHSSCLGTQGLAVSFHMWPQPLCSCPCPLERRVLADTGSLPPGRGAAGGEGCGSPVCSGDPSRFPEETARGSQAAAPRVEPDHGWPAWEHCPPAPPDATSPGAGWSGQGPEGASISWLWVMSHGWSQDGGLPLRVPGPRVDRQGERLA